MLRAAAVFLVAAVLLTSTAQAQFIVGHRGASHDAPENTLASFKLAWEQGADGIEGDFYLTSDGKIICCHDADTKRTAGVKRVIKDTTFDELRSLEVGSWKNEKFRGERMPTLEEVIATVPKRKLFFIELKVGPEIVAPMIDALKKSSLNLEQIVVISFNEKTVAEVEKQWPELRTQWLVRYEQDEKSGQWKPARETVEATLKQLGADALGSQAEPKQVDEKFLKALCDAGQCEFGVWTVDEPRIARYYQKLGAWSITTNRPGWLRRQLQAKQQATPQPAAAK